MQILKIVTILYTISLGIMLGVAIFSGGIVAPIVFNSELYLDNKLLSRFQEGLIMSEVFLKVGYFVTFVVLIVVIYEGYRYKIYIRDTISLIASFLVVTTGLLYAHYYIPQILEMQNLGEELTKSEVFKNTHFASEIDFKIFTASILVLLFRTLYVNFRT